MFIGLGYPKQEKWMSENSPQLSMPLLGVGAAFDFLYLSKSYRLPKQFKELG